MRPKYLIGQPLFRNHNILPDGMYYRYQDHEHLVMVISRDASSISFQTTLLSKPAEFAFAMQEGILFFLARFGRYHWKKAPYYWYGVPEAERSLPREIEKPDGSAELQILVIDHLFGGVQGIRKVLLPAEFTTSLHGAIEQQASGPNLGAKGYRGALARVQEKYPRPKDLVAVAQARMTDIPTPRLPWETIYEDEVEMESQDRLTELTIPFSLRVAAQTHKFEDRRSD